MKVSTLSTEQRLEHIQLVWSILDAMDLNVVARADELMAMEAGLE